MNSIKHPPAALFGLCALLAVTLAAPISPAGAAPDDKEKGARQFYLTKDSYDGAHALTACADSPSSRGCSFSTSAARGCLIASRTYRLRHGWTTSVPLWTRQEARRPRSLDVRRAAR